MTSPVQKKYKWDVWWFVMGKKAFRKGTIWTGYGCDRVAWSSTAPPTWRRFAPRWEHQSSQWTRPNRPSQSDRDNSRRREGRRGTIAAQARQPHQSHSHRITLFSSQACITRDRPTIQNYPLIIRLHYRVTSYRVVSIILHTCGIYCKCFFLSGITRRDSLKNISNFFSAYISLFHGKIINWMLPLEQNVTSCLHEYVMINLWSTGNREKSEQRCAIRFE